MFYVYIHTHINSFEYSQQTKEVEINIPILQMSKLKCGSLG